MTIDISLVVVILNFILLMIVLNSLLYKPLKGYFTARQKKVEDDIMQAEQSIEKANQLVTQKENEMRLALDDARKMKENIRRDAETQAEDIIKVAKQKEHEIIAQEENKIRELHHQATIQIEAELSALIADLTARVLAEKIDSEKDKQLILKLLENRG